MPEDLFARPEQVGKLQIKRALMLLEEGEGLQYIPAAHRTHTIAGAFMALTGESLSEVEHQCARIGQALASMGVDPWQIATLTIDGIKQCHYRLAHRSITMAQLANHVIGYGTRAITVMLSEVPSAVPYASAASAVPPAMPYAMPYAMPRPVLQALLAVPSRMRGAPTTGAAVAPPRGTSSIVPPLAPLPRYRYIIPRPTTTLPSMPTPPQQ